MLEANFDPTSAASMLAGFAILGTIIGVVMRGWSTFRGFVRTFFSYFISTVSLDDDETAQAVLAYMLKTHKRSTWGPRVFGGKYESFRDGKYGHVSFEFFGANRTTFWRGVVPIFYTATPEAPATKDNPIITWGGRTKPKIKAGLVFFRGTCDVDKIVREASATRNELFWSKNTNRRFFIKKVPDANEEGENRFSASTHMSWFHEGVYRLLGQTADDLGRRNETSGPPTSNLYFPTHVRKMIEEIRLWRDRREWYAQRGIPWKRGWLLYGLPGTGKSAIARAIAEEMDMPLFTFSLGTMMNGDLEKSWANMQAHVPCVALIEDFDNVFHGRENVYGKPKLEDVIKGAGPPKEGTVEVPTTGRLSFDCLLNCIDGVDKGGGVFTIITTNHVEVLDPALGQPRKNPDGTVDFISTRPGRIDRAMELGYMTVEDKLQLAKRIFFDSPDGYERIRAEVAAADRPETPAQFQERCAQMALELLWQQLQQQQRPQEVPAVMSNGHVKKSSWKKLFQKT